VVVFGEDAAESITPLDVEVVDSRAFGDRWWWWLWGCGGVEGSAPTTLTARSRPGTRTSPPRCGGDCWTGSPTCGTPRSISG